MSDRSGPITSYFPKSVFDRRFSSVGEAAVGLDAGCEEVIARLQGLTAAELDTPRAPGKWSAAEIVDHLVLANRLFCRALGTTFAGTPPPVMPRGHLSEDGKPVAAPEAEPRAGRSRAELTADLRESTTGLVDLGKRLDAVGKADAPCLVHAFFGQLTVLECLQLAAWHMRWHLRQLPQ